MAYVRYRGLGLPAIDILLLLHFAVVFKFHVFPFPPSKAKLIGYLSIISQNAANCSLRFSFLITFFCDMEGDKMVRKMEMKSEMEPIFLS